MLITAVTPGERTGASALVQTHGLGWSTMDTDQPTIEELEAQAMAEADANVDVATETPEERASRREQVGRRARVGFEARGLDLRVHRHEVGRLPADGAAVVLLDARPAANHDCLDARVHIHRDLSARQWAWRSGRGERTVKRLHELAQRPLLTMTMSSIRAPQCPGM